ncbi:MobP2 family relaxase [Romboutsia sp. 1001285H_161024_C4]|uniref:MobP2 family relaxase n=1 Tax=Romboutsia sp. 1001285H_161024_C4 TaxID=2787109 RepID=UPI001897E8BD|nr:MobP2 family relaxase [Romboutsia sp. 1001285H_161024_C4]
MSGVNQSPGVVVVSKFISFNSKTFSSYIDYMDREEAKRNKSFNRYSLYNDYMGNPKKTTGLFNKDTDLMNDNEKLDAKELFVKAQKNKSILWQDVFSFDNKWLEKQGLYNPRTKELDEKKVKDAVRKSIGFAVEKKCIAETCVWNGAIHFNTDNIHVHVAICEPNPTIQRGKRTQKTLDIMKSKFVNELLDSKENFLDINNIIRKDIVDSKKNSKIKEDKKLKELTRNVIRNLPKDKRHWHYGYNTMNDAKKYLDEMTKYYIDTYKKDEFKELILKLDKQEDVFKETYGVGQRSKFKDYKENKIDELYKRMGNAFLTEIKAYIKREDELDKIVNQKKINKLYSNKSSKLIISKKELKNIEKALSNEFDSIKNMDYYQRLQYKIDNGINI